MRRMYARVADNTLATGGVMSLVLATINYFSPSEWMVIGVLVGIACSIIGCIAGVMFRCRRERLLKEWIRSRGALRAESVEPEEISKLWED